MTEDTPYTIDGTGQKPIVTVGEETVIAESYMIFDQCAAIAQAWYRNHIKSV